jgi:SOS-response transcriptional repressor LexA
VKKAVIETSGILSGTADSYLFKAEDFKEKVSPEVPVYLMQVNSGIMSDAGIEKGDQVVVERNKIPVNGNIIIARIGNDLCIRKIIIEESRKTLIAPGMQVSPLIIDNHIMCWGVVIYVLKKLTSASAFHQRINSFSW